MILMRPIFSAFAHQTLEIPFIFGGHAIHLVASSQIFWRGVLQEIGVPGRVFHFPDSGTVRHVQQAVATVKPGAHIGYQSVHPVAHSGRRIDQRG